jgi:hypothetical protein
MTFRIVPKIKCKVLATTLVNDKPKSEVRRWVMLTNEQAFFIANAFNLQKLSWTEAVAKKRQCIADCSL